MFRPDGKFREFYFTETGDTDIATQAGSAKGGFGGIFRLEQRDASSNRGKLEIFYRADAANGGLDNIGFLTSRTVVAVQDYGDAAHEQLHAFDSALAFDIRSLASDPKRLIAEGRDASATIDSALRGPDARLPERR